MTETHVRSKCRHNLKHKSMPSKTQQWDINKRDIRESKIHSAIQLESMSSKDSPCGCKHTPAAAKSAKASKTSLVSEGQPHWLKDEMQMGPVRTHASR